MDIDGIVTPSVTDEISQAQEVGSLSEVSYKPLGF